METLNNIKAAETEIKKRGQKRQKKSKEKRQSIHIESSDESEVGFDNDIVENLDFIEVEL